MSRWQIKSIIFYSHDARFFTLDFKLNDVTIIVGESNSGKSAIIDTIDYTMGSSKCHIPVYIRDRCSWVGILWIYEKTEVLICRRIPEFGTLSSEEVFFSVGSPLTLPTAADQLSANTNSDGALRKFEQALLLADVNGEKQDVRISVKNALSYVIVGDDVIIDKTLLFRGMKEWRPAVVDSLPYFMGAVDETTAANEQKLKKLRTKLTKEESRRSAVQLEDESSITKAKELLIEAAEVGLVPQQASESMSKLEIRGKLEEIVQWVPGAETESNSSDQLAPLYIQEREFLRTLSQLRAGQSAARSAIQSASQFAIVVEEQRAKLNLVELFKPEHETETCPVCSSRLASTTADITAIYGMLAHIDGELEEVEQDRPQIDSYLATLDGQIAAEVDNLRRVRGQISAAVRQSQGNAAALQGDSRRMRVVGRVSFFLEQTTEDPDKLSDSKYQDLLKQIEELESTLDPDAKAERLDALQFLVSTHANEIFKKLPFDSNFRHVQLTFDVRQLVVKFIDGSRLLQMRDIGGDESYLSSRLSVVLGLHRLFSENKRPVPGVVILDQVSRPFYNPETNKNEIVLNSADRVDLKQYFDTIFAEVETQKDLQVIVLEHAYFQDFPKYQKAVIKRWGKKKDGKEKLIPFDWPRITVDGTLDKTQQGDEDEPSKEGA